MSKKTEKTPAAAAPRKSGLKKAQEFAAPLPPGKALEAIAKGKVKSIIYDACSVKDCIKPSTITGKCEEHTDANEQVPAPKAKAKKPTKTQLEADVELAKVTLPPELQAQFAKMVTEATKTSPIPAPKKAPASPAKASKRGPKAGDASPVIAKLLEKGWTYRTIGQALGGLNSGYARDWHNGTGCRRLVQVTALLDKAPPAPEKVETGSLKAPVQSKAAKAVREPTPRVEDPRQLRLGLETIHDALGRLLGYSKAQ